MAVLEVHSLSGYNNIPDGLLDKYRSLGLKRIDNEITKLVMYLDEIPREQLCVDVPMEKVNDVSNLQSAEVSVQSYYQPGEWNIVFVWLLSLYSTRTQFALGTSGIAMPCCLSLFCSRLEPNAVSGGIWALVLLGTLFTRSLTK